MSKREFGHEARWLQIRWWQKLWPVACVRSFLLARGIGYVNTNTDWPSFWRIAMRHAPISFRWFGRSINFDDISAVYSRWDEWQMAAKQWQPGDRIWPFKFNEFTMAFRAGYVIVRNGEPVTGVVVLLS